MIVISQLDAILIGVTPPKSCAELMRALQLLCLLHGSDSVAAQYAVLTFEAGQPNQIVLTEQLTGLAIIDLGELQRLLVGTQKTGANKLGWMPLLDRVAAFID